jgi:hypothetical protein
VKQLTFDIASTGVHPTLIKTEKKPSLKMWEQLISLKKQEHAAISRPVQYLRSLWEKGYAAIVVHNDSIIAYMGKSSVYDEDIAHRIAAILNIEPTEMPDVSIYQRHSSWVSKEWRSMGIMTAIKKELIPPSNVDLTISCASRGIASVPLWEKSGWNMVPWDRFPFVSSLEAWFTDVDTSIPKKYGIGIGWHTDVGRPWNGRELFPRIDRNHPWHLYAYFGVSSLELAKDIEKRLATALGYDLQRWHDAIECIFGDTVLNPPIDPRN